MRDFAEIQRERKLYEFVDVPEGTLYLGKPKHCSPKIVVRRFDGTLPVTRLGAFVEIVRGCQAWIEAHPALAELVRVEQPTEVGTDFVARPHHVYSTSTSSYVDDEDPPTPPPELFSMQKTFRDLRPSVRTPRERLLTDILARSLIEPSGKTFFKSKEDRWLVVEPKIRPDDLEQWVALAT